MTAGDGSDGVYHRKHRKPEGKGNSGVSNFVSSENGSAASAKHEHKGTDKFRNVSIHGIKLLREILSGISRFGERRIEAQRRHLGRKAWSRMAIFMGLATLMRRLRTA